MLAIKAEVGMTVEGKYWFKIRFEDLHKLISYDEFRTFVMNFYGTLGQFLPRHAYYTRRMEKIYEFKWRPPVSWPRRSLKKWRPKVRVNMIRGVDW